MPTRCNHLVGILFPHINDDARSKSHQKHILYRISVDVAIREVTDKNFYRNSHANFCLLLIPINFVIHVDELFV